MDTLPALDLANAFYSLGEREFFHPYQTFPAETALVKKLIAEAGALSAEQFFLFSRRLVGNLAAFCDGEHHDPGVLYRAFDGLDQVLGIDYRETHAMMPASDGIERLYEGAGIGVQTSYATILRVLRHLGFAENAHLIDLGSGFGRVGLAAGLWREDLRCTGYEYVGHRVATANASAVRAGVAERVHFVRQDLSAAEFEIPTADAYYLYDPFSAPTYDRVFTRLTSIARRRPIAVIAKAGARETFQRFLEAKEWAAPEPIDEGTVLLFRSVLT